MTNKPLTLTRQYPRLKTLRFELREAKQKGSFHLPQLSLCVNGEENGERGNGEAAEKISESEKMVLKSVSRYCFHNMVSFETHSLLKTNKT